jgi:hypothetical protein
MVCSNSPVRSPILLLSRHTQFQVITRLKSATRWHRVGGQTTASWRWRPSRSGFLGRRSSPLAVGLARAPLRIVRPAHARSSPDLRYVASSPAHDRSSPDLRYVASSHRSPRCGGSGCLLFLKELVLLTMAFELTEQSGGSPKSSRIDDFPSAEGHFRSKV